MEVKTNYNKFFNLEEIVEMIRAYKPGFNQRRFVDAFNFAEKAHRGQMRKDEITPYIAHPVEVVKILVDLHADEDVLISALLHDVPEDTPRTIEEIKDKFGDAIAFLVEGVTKLSKVQYKNDMPRRQVHSLKKLFMHSAQDVRIIIIKLADRLHNMQTLDNIDRAEKRIRIARETLEIYVPIANLLGIHVLKSQLEEYCFKHLFPIEYDALKKKLDACDKSQKVTYIKFKNALKRLLEKNKINATTKQKNRNLYTVYRKLCAEGKSIDDADGRFAMMVIVDSVESCYQVLGILHCHFTPNPGRFKDYIANPKPNGYQSLHTTIFGPSGVPVRVQIASAEMHNNAEYGIVSQHSGGKNFLKDKRIQWVNKVVNIGAIKNSNSINDPFLEDLKLDILHDRIVVFTPKGDPIDLPEGATVIDFAYTIHSDLGNHAQKAEVNSKFKSISHPLKTGDVVAIVTSEERRPELDWLSFVKTNIAKKKIKEYLKQVDKEIKLRKGRKKIQRAFDIADLGLYKNMRHSKIRKMINKQYERDFDSAAALQTAVAEGQFSSVDVAKAVKSNQSYSYWERVKFFLKLASGEGPESFNIKIEAENRFGLLNEISEKLYKYALDMTYMKGWSSKSKKFAYFNAKIIVDDIEKIEQAINELQQLDGVNNVYSISNKGAVMFWILASIVGGSWVAHPFVLNYISHSNFMIGSGSVTSYIANIALMVLIMLVLYLSHMAKKYFPIVRNSGLIWFVSSLIGVLAAGTLFVELSYFDLQMNWFALILELSAIYVYLIMSYVNFMKNESV